MSSNTQESSMKALVVEDAAVDSLIFSTMLAENGKEAVDMFLMGKKFDIVLCDKYMPVMNGLEAVENICAMGETDVKIIGVSADYDAMEAFMRVGADVFMMKPVSLDALGAMIQEVINKKNNAMV